MFLLILLATVCLPSSTVLATYDKRYYDVEDAENLFKDYLNEHKKEYNQEQYFERLTIFKENLKVINKKNAMSPDTVFAVNHFADLKPHERQQYHGLIHPRENRTKIALPDLPTPTEDKCDWRDRNAVTHVKNQGNCLSCYIFSAVGAIEGQYSIKYHQCPAFSEGQVLDCLKSGGCNGGFMHEVFQELAKTKKKLEQEENYKYDPPKDSCHDDASKGVVQVTGGNEVQIKNEEELMKLVAHYGPLAVGIAADDFDFYKGGILEPDACKGQQLDHGVLLVGYGEENGKKFWIIKNSWGAKWGEKGYVRLLRGVDACRMGTGYTSVCHVA